MTVATQTTAKPPVLPFCKENIPAELKELQIWMVWRYQQKTVGNRFVKVAYSPITKNPIQGMHETWLEQCGSFEQACELYENTIDNDGQQMFDGLGITVRDGLLVVDLDYCRNPKTGEIAPWAASILDRFPTYADASPSGKGIHLYLKASIPSGSYRRIDDDITIHNFVRFLTITGDTVSNYPVADNLNSELNQLRQDLSLLMSAYKHSKFIWSGNPNHNADDCVLEVLTNLCGENTEAIQRFQPLVHLYKTNWIANIIANHLNETEQGPRKQLYMLVHHLGVDQSFALLKEAQIAQALANQNHAAVAQAVLLLKETQEVQTPTAQAKVAHAQAIIQDAVNTGWMLANGSRRRTFGGIWFHLVRRKGPDSIKALWYQKRKRKTNSNQPVQNQPKKQTQSPAKTKQKKSQAVPLVWSERLNIFNQITEKGIARTARVTLTGLLVGALQKSLLTGIQVNQTPKLSKALPNIDKFDTTTDWYVCVISTQWQIVAEAFMKKDPLIVTGYPQLNPKTHKPSLATMNMTPKQSKQPKAPKQSVGVEKTAQTEKTEQTEKPVVSTAVIRLEGRPGTVIQDGTCVVTLFKAPREFAPPNLPKDLPHQHLLIIPALQGGETLHKPLLIPALI